MIEIYQKYRKTGQISPGRNGKGETVLNGVYIAVLKTSAGVVTTKVAVAK